VANKRKNKQMENKDIKGLSDQDLHEKIKEEKAGLNKMTLNHTISPVENPAIIRINRRNIARMVTEVNNRKKASKN
jgi:large subunit ribosomal protein L29